MKLRSLLATATFLTTLSTSSLFAQGVGINSTGASAHSAAILDVSSTDKGILMPRMTTAQRQAISSPTDGLMVFDTDKNCFAVYKGSAWFFMCGEIEQILGLVSGDAQSISCGALPLSSPLVVSVVDGLGNPVQNETVTFTVTAGGGSLSSASVLTNASGEAQVNWTVGASGTQTVSVSATNIGTVSFSATITGVTPVVSNQITDARDGEVYDVVNINGVSWMADNLRYNAFGSHLNPSNPAPEYGRLYDWTTAMGGATSSNTSPSAVQGVCPCGWHIPSDAEWMAMEMALGMGAGDASSTGFRGGATISDAMKSTTGWNASGNGTNSSSLNMVPAEEYTGGGFTTLGNNAYFWTSYESGGLNAYYRGLNNASSGVLRTTTSKNDAYSIRCVQD